MKKITKQELLKELRKLRKSSDTEAAHFNADSLLLEYIDDDEVAKLFYKIPRWYA